MDKLALPPDDRKTYGNVSCIVDVNFLSTKEQKHNGRSSVPSIYSLKPTFHATCPTLCPQELTYVTTSTVPLLL